MRRPTAGSFLAAPHLVVILVIAANVAAYLACLRAGGSLAVPASLLAAAGALTPVALQPGEWWRLGAAGFLHADPTHLATNVLSLLLVGPILERRLGPTAFALVYAASLAGAGITSVLMHPGPFVGVGASGAVFGIMGGLLALWALGAEELSPAFFLFNFGLNAALASRDPRIDWAAHAGGLVAGMAMVALVDMASRANAHWLRCKFPEFVRVEVLALLVVGGAALWPHPLPGPAGLDPRLAAAGWIAGATSAALAAVKALDLLLSARRGLAAVVVLLAAGNAAAVWVAVGPLLVPLARACAMAGAFGAPDGGAAGLLCPNLARLPAVAAGLATGLTLLALLRPLRRGLGDVGFVGATFVGDRRREHGLVRPTRHTRA